MNTGSYSEDVRVGAPGQRLVTLGALIATLGCACNGPPPPAPSPVIMATPSTVCLGDDFKTVITLDGTQSSAVLALEPLTFDGGAPPLTYAWTLAGSAYRIVSGTLTASKLTVTIAGNEPLQIDLLVQNTTGGSADSTATISVTPPNDAGVCPLVDAGACPLGDASPDAAGDAGPCPLVDAGVGALGDAG